MSSQNITTKTTKTMKRQEISTLQRTPPKSFKRYNKIGRNKFLSKNGSTPRKQTYILNELGWSLCNTPHNATVTGILVKQLSDGSVAYKANMRVGDIITKVNAEETLYRKDLLKIFKKQKQSKNTRKKNQKMTLTIIRDGKRMIIPLRLSAC